MKKEIESRKFEGQMKLQGDYYITSLSIFINSFLIHLKKQIAKKENGMTELEVIQ